MNGLLHVFEILGVIAFSVSGAMIAIRKHADPFGVVFLGTITAVGGGVTRDLLLGISPSTLFRDWTFILVAMATALAVFLVAAITKKRYVAAERKIERIDNVFDALGLGIFAATGTRIAMATPYGSNPLVAVILGGMLTSIGGGLYRDIILREIPTVLKKHIYALAAIAGAALYFLLITLGVADILSISICAFLVFSLRMLATIFKWNLPSAL